MKITKIDAHDRYQFFQKQNFSIEDCCQNLIDQMPFGKHPFYIFAHTRTDDDGVTKRLIWQPRLTKPKAQTNSMLFKAYPGTDHIKVIWMIPDRALFGQYGKGLVTENKLVSESIQLFEHNREELERKEEDDLDDSTIDGIYRSLAEEAKKRRAGKKVSILEGSDILARDTASVAKPIYEAAPPS